MIPEKLIISAFGPYAKEVSIDFTKLGENGLYLITGDTGSGKTTIFDAITFALFGEASGDEREAKMFRSKYADNTTPTFVELTFRYNNKKYTIHRSPEYERKALRGDGITKQASEVELVRPNGAPITKSNEVNTYIESILGVNRDQFAQIAMIAQGEFRKLLNAETKDRQEIFRKLFKTDNYKYLQENLKNEANTLYREYEEEKRSIAQYINEIKPPYDDKDDENIELINNLQELKAGELPFSDAKEILTNIINTDRCLDKEFHKILDKAHRIYDTNIELVKKDEEASRIQEELSRAISTKKMLDYNVQKYQKDFERLPKIEDANKLEIEAEKVSEQINLFDSIRDRKIEANNQKSVYEEENLTLKNIEKDIEDNANEIKNLRNEAKKIVDLSSEKNQLTSERSECIVKKSSLSKILESEITREKNIVILEDLRKDYSILRNAFAKSEKEWQIKNQLFLDNQAGVLAENLKNGEPCPVCGSKEHPNIAHKLEVVPTENELKILEEKRNDDHKKMIDKSEVANSIKTKITTIEEGIKNEFKNIFENPIKNLEDGINDSKLLYNENKSKIEKIEKQLHDISELEKKRDSIEEKIETCEKREKTLIIKQKETTAKLNERKVKIRTAEEFIRENSKKIKYDSKDSAIAKRTELTEKAKLIKNQIDSLTAKIKENEIASGRLAGEISTLKSQTKKLPKPIKNINKFKDTLNELSSLIDKYEAYRNDINYHVKTNETILERVSHNLKKYNEIEKKYSWLRNLSDTANGALKGKEKIMLEIYVQTTFFDRIINRANTRFFKMTNGHFELKRAKNALNKTSQSGLDLNIIDHYNGTERSVKTLSGGESFMASLSLALGLSDEIQASAGGIQLKTMFIDEGFGSLDAATLSQALNSLVELSNPEGGKLVGIISHIEELKNRIDKQIIVTKSQTGESSVKLVA